jgi:hypothetical protein
MIVGKTGLSLQSGGKNMQGSAKTSHPYGFSDVGDRQLLSGRAQSGAAR